MGELFIIRPEKLEPGTFECISHEAIDSLPPLAYAVLSYRLRRHPEAAQPPADAIWERWRGQHAKNEAPGQEAVRAADALLEERGYKHKLLRRRGRDNIWVTKVYAVPTPLNEQCPDADCKSCERFGRGVFATSENREQLGQTHPSDVANLGAPKTPRQKLQTGRPTDVKNPDVETPASPGPHDTRSPTKTPPSVGPRNTRAPISDEYLDSVIEELGTELKADADEYGVICGMAEKGSHPQEIRNTIRKWREPP